MKKFLGLALLIIFFGSTVYIFSKLYRKENIKLTDSKLKWEIKYKGIKGAKDFTFDENNNYYIAFSNRVQLIDHLGRSRILFKGDDLSICSITYIKNKLYYITGCKLMSYDLKNGSNTVIMSNLPNFGDYKDSKLLARDNILLITIGAATNSGIVGEDNKWINENPFQHDISPKTLTISSRGSSKQKTGAFVPYNSQNSSGQIIPAHSPGNASIIGYNVDNSSTWLYAWGIRNVGGIDFNSEGKIYMTVGGLEDRGARPVKGDVDYIYELKEGIWYGWPDYSGGDPVNSPRFKGGNNQRIPFVLDKHPTTNPPAPVYQHKSLASLKELAIDRNGSIGEKDSIYFYDSKDNILYEMNKTEIINERLKLSVGSHLESIKMHGKSLVVLDSEKGYLSIVAAKNLNGVILNKALAYYVLGLIVVIITCIMWKMKSE